MATHFHQYDYIVVVNHDHFFFDTVAIIKRIENGSILCQDLDENNHNEFEATPTDIHPINNYPNSMFHHIAIEHWMNESHHSRRRANLLITDDDKYQSLIKTITKDLFFHPGPLTNPTIISQFQSTLPKWFSYLLHNFLNHIPEHPSTMFETKHPDLYAECVTILSRRKINSSAILMCSLLVEEEEPDPLFGFHWYIHEMTHQIVSLLHVYSQPRFTIPTDI
jgi:hypothetical protein